MNTSDKDHYKYITGYHGTTSREKVLIESKGIDVNTSSPRDDHWLGKGFYLFEFPFYAYYWAHAKAINQRKKYKDDSIKAVVYKVNVKVKTSHFMDLDDPLQIRKLSNALKDLDSNYTPNDLGENPIIPENMTTTFFYTYFKELYNIYVLTRTFQKLNPKYKKNICDRSIIRNKYAKDIMELPFSEKQICISNNSCIVSFTEENISKLIDIDLIT